MYQILDFCSGSYFSCALDGNHQVKCIGHNTSGQLGIGNKASKGSSALHMGASLQSVSLASAENTIKISCGAWFACAIFNDKRMKCWGDNSKGTLAIGTTEDMGDNNNEMGSNLPFAKFGGFDIEQVITADQHTCVLLSNNKIRCVGAATYGQLGNGDIFQKGHNGTTTGESLPFADLGSSNPVKIFSGSGAWHTCAKLANDALKCWGGNFHGELGLRDVNHRGDGLTSGPSPSPEADMGNNLPEIDLDGKIAVQVSLGNKFTCAVLNDESTRCWGLNDVGQLGIGTTNSYGHSLGQMGNHLPSMMLGTGLKSLTVKAGVFHVCMLLTTNAVKCFGRNAESQLGLGDTTNRGTSPTLAGDNVPVVSLGPGLSVTDISVGGYHVCALFTGVKVKCWGANNHGQLGLGDSNNRGDTSSEMGANLQFINLFVTPTPTKSPVTPIPTKSPSRRPSASPSEPTSSPVEQLTNTPTTSSPTKKPEEESSSLIGGVAAGSVMGILVMAFIFYKCSSGPAAPAARAPPRLPQAAEIIEEIDPVATPMYDEGAVVIGMPENEPMPVYNEPMPVYNQPVPVYSQPMPVYTEPVASYSESRPRQSHSYQKEDRYSDAASIPMANIVDERAAERQAKGQSSSIYPKFS